MRKRTSFICLAVFFLWTSLAFSQESYKTHVVQKKQTWADLAVIYDLPMDKIAKLNNRTIKDMLYRGEGIKIPFKETKKTQTITDKPLLEESPVGLVIDVTDQEASVSKKQPGLIDKLPVKEIGIILIVVFFILLLIGNLRKKPKKREEPKLRSVKNNEIIVSLDGGYLIPCKHEDGYYHCPIEECNSRKKEFQDLRRHLIKNHLHNGQLSPYLKTRHSSNVA